MPGKVSKMDVTLAPLEHGQIYRYLSHIASIQGIVKQGCLTLVLLSENLNHTITASQPLHHTATCLVKCYRIFRGGVEFPLLGLSQRSMQIKGDSKLYN